MKIRKQLNALDVNPKSAQDVWDRRRALNVMRILCYTMEIALVTAGMDYFWRQAVVNVILVQSYAPRVILLKHVAHAEGMGYFRTDTVFPIVQKGNYSLLAFLYINLYSYSSYEAEC